MTDDDGSHGARELFALTLRDGGKVVLLAVAVGVCYMAGEALGGETFGLLGAALAFGVLAYATGESMINPAPGADDVETVENTENGTDE